MQNKKIITNEILRVRQHTLSEFNLIDGLVFYVASKTRLLIDQDNGGLRNYWIFFKLMKWNFVA